MGGSMIIDNPHFELGWSTGHLGADRALTVLALLITLLVIYRFWFRDEHIGTRPGGRYNAEKGKRSWTGPLRSPIENVKIKLDDSKPMSAEKSMADPMLQLHSVRASGFETVPLLNRNEARLLPLLEKTVRDHGDGHRVMAQTSLGELIRPTGDPITTGHLSAARASINSKRLDFAIINRRGHLVAAVEYQGTGHHIKDDAFLRDAVKREALRKAGVPYIEIMPDDTSEMIYRRLRDVLVPQKVALTAPSGSYQKTGRPN